MAEQALVEPGDVGRDDFALPAAQRALATHQHLGGIEQWPAVWGRKSIGPIIPGMSGKSIEGISRYLSKRHVIALHGVS